ncbi:hypothetical protein [Roseomonas sp. BN140053]|uniref:hypothetical protein n=1 Tax=Roseomonas sp. BN140053 TaxID=3391898 RepID=UPI0039EB61EA
MAAFLATICLVTAAPALAQEAAWSGRLRCEPVPGTTQGVLNTPFRLTVSGTTARYERDVLTASGQTSGNVEQGRGTVSADGMVRLEGGASGRGFSYTSQYQGRLTGTAATLEGWQDWNSRDSQSRRPCTVTLQRN